MAIWHSLGRGNSINIPYAVSQNSLEEPFAQQRLFIYQHHRTRHRYGKRRIDIIVDTERAEL